MIADKRIKAIALCVSKDPTRQDLQKVYVNGDTAVATDGHIFARAKFSKYAEADFPGNTEESPGAIECLVEPKTIARAFRDMPKKSVLPITQCVYIGQKNGTVIVRHILPSMQAIEEKNPQGLDVYPDYERVLPSGRQEITFALDGLYIERIVKMVKKCGNPVTHED